MIIKYTDTELQSLKEELLKLEIKLQSLSDEKNEYLRDIEDFNLQYKYIEELYLKYPELAPQYFKLKNKISLSQRYSDAKLKTIEGLMEFM